MSVTTMVLLLSIGMSSEPVERGFEREIKKRLEYWAKLRRERRA